MVPPSPANEGSVLKCAEGDLCRFGRLATERKHRCTTRCGGYTHSAFCGVQEHKKKYTNKTAYKTHRCQKCAAALEKTKFVHKPPIDIGEEESELDLECNKSSKNDRNSAWIQKHSKSTTVPTSASNGTKENAEKSTAASFSSASKTIKKTERRKG
eukprot:9592158-Ditylum_brightwellii.AAC.1